MRTWPCPAHGEVTSVDLYLCSAVLDILKRIIFILLLCGAIPETAKITSDSQCRIAQEAK